MTASLAERISNKSHQYYLKVNMSKWCPVKIHFIRAKDVSRFKWILSAKILDYKNLIVSSQRLVGYFILHRHSESHEQSNRTPVGDN